jgi:hypothetical protein
VRWRPTTAKPLNFKTAQHPQTAFGVVKDKIPRRGRVGGVVSNFRPPNHFDSTRMAQNLHTISMTTSFRANVSWFIKFGVHLNYPGETGAHIDAGPGGLHMTAIARALFRGLEDEIENLQAVALFSGIGLLVSLFLLLRGWI